MDVSPAHSSVGSPRPLTNDRREIFAWTMYDWANSAFSTTVVAVFLGPYLTGLVKAATAAGVLYLGQTPIQYNSFFTYCVSASVLLQVTLLPLLGALADYSHLRKQFLMLFSTMGAVSTMLLFFVGPGGYWPAGILFIVANLAFGASIVFYNSYLPDIASEDQRDRVSAAGFAMGYLGGGLLLLLNLVLYLFKGRLGMDDALVARSSLASAGVWWLAFSLITFRALRPRQAVRPLPPGAAYLSIGFRQLAALLDARASTVTVLMLLPLAIPFLILAGLPVTVALLPALGPIAVLGIFMLRKGRSQPEGMKYLLAFLLYNDGIQTVIVVAAIFAAEELKMLSTSLILVILMIQFVAVGGAYLFGHLARWIGTKRAIMTSLCLWSLVVVYAYFGMRDQAPVAGLGISRAQLEFWLLGGLIALVLGGSQALSRSLFAQMIPKNQEAEYFSFYEISDRGTAWLGTFIFGLANQLTGSLRAGVFSLIFFFVAGLLLLLFVDVPRAIAQARQVSGMHM